MAKKPKRPIVITIKRIASDQEILEVVDIVRREGVAVEVEREGAPSVIIMPARPKVLLPHLVQPHVVPAVDEDALEEALSLAGAWKDLDTDTMLKDIYEARHRFKTRPPVTFND